MMNLKRLLTLHRVQTNKVHRGFSVSLFIVAICGFADATFLTIEHYMNAIPPCAIGSCEQVLTSTFSSIWGIPVALLGVIYYFVIVVLLFAYFESRKHIFLKIALFTTIFGLFASIWFVCVQLFVIHAICQYCMVSAMTSTILFIIAATAIHRYRETGELKSTTSEIL
jgi:uncharacterized membrane protein